MRRYKPTRFATVHEVREAAAGPYPAVAPVPGEPVVLDTARHARLIQEGGARASTFESASAALQRLRQSKRSA